MLKKMPGVKVVEEENVPETAAVQRSMAGMVAQDGAELVFATSFGYFSPHVVEDRPKKFPNARFAHCGGLWTDKDPKNTGSFFGYIDECQYLNGVVAGHMSKSKKIGFIAAEETDSAGVAQHQRLHHGRAIGRSRASPPM